MANTNTGTRTEVTYEFEISQPDVVAMMNDPQVLIEGGDVSASQTFTLVLRKSNGSEVLLREMKETDTLLFRYTKVDVSNDPQELGAIDVQA